MLLFPSRQQMQHMPMLKSRYPANWHEIALQIKEKANWKCEECGRECRKAGESLTEFIKRIAPTADLLIEIVAKPTRVVLTTSHLDHIPENCEASNLKALCAPCHCRYDLKAMPQKKMLKREFYGQLKLFDY